MSNYWIGVVSKDHVDIGVAGGITAGQPRQGRAARAHACAATASLSIRRAVVSRRRATAGVHPPSVAFANGTVYQAVGRRSFGSISPRRRLLPRSRRPVRPLIEELTFIRSKTHWGAAFRFGVLRVPEADFALIARAMGRSFADDFALLPAQLPPQLPPTPAAPRLPILDVTSRLRYVRRDGFLAERRRSLARDQGPVAVVALPRTRRLPSSMRALAARRQSLRRRAEVRISGCRRS